MSTQLILTSNVHGLGAEGDQVVVSDGYARNFLIPQSMAMIATPSAMRRIESLKVLRTERERKELEQAQEVASKISKLNSTVELQVGESGKAFGAITSSDIANALASCGFKMDRKAVLLDEPIKKSGTFDIPIRIHSQVTATFKLTVVSPNLPIAPTAHESKEQSIQPRRVSQKAKTLKRKS